MQTQLARDVKDEKIDDQEMMLEFTEYVVTVININHKFVKFISVAAMAVTHIIMLNVDYILNK